MRRAWVLALAVVVLAAGCGKRERKSSELQFELQSDTAGLSEGKPLLTRIEPYRMDNGALRVRGQVGFPDGVRLQISIFRKGTKDMVGRVQVVIENHRFDTPPILSDGRPLPHGGYRFEYLSLFNEAWQGEEVMRRTREGQGLRGPGITRDRLGD